MTPIFLDIEVLQQDPEPFMVPEPEDLTPPANYTKPETIDKWRAEKLAAQASELRERTSLEPLLGGTVWCVGVATGERTPTVYHAPTPDESGELALLQQVETLLARVTQPAWVTWCGGHYDLPFLAKRALRHGLFALARLMSQDKPWSKRNVDLFPVWQQHDRSAKGRLVDVARFLGLGVTDGVTGKGVSAALAAGDTAAVLEHCREDVALLRQVYWRMRAAGWVDLGDIIPDDLPVRPPRASPADEARQLMIVATKNKVKQSAEAAGIPWVGKPPVEDGPDLSKASFGKLQRFVANLKELDDQATKETQVGTVPKVS